MAVFAKNSVGILGMLGLLTMAMTPLIFIDGAQHVHAEVLRWAR